MFFLAMVQVGQASVCSPERPAQQQTVSQETLLWRPHGLLVQHTISLTGFICCHVVFWEVPWTANEGLGVLFTGLELFHGVMWSLPL